MLNKEAQSKFNPALPDLLGKNFRDTLEHCATILSKKHTKKITLES
jgi:hypothetical protein